MIAQTDEDQMDNSLADPTQSELSQMDKGVASAASLSIGGIVTIPISQLDKYIVTCEISGPIVTGDFRRIRRLAQQLEQWWRSDNKFFVLMVSKSIENVYRHEANSELRM